MRAHTWRGVGVSWKISGGWGGWALTAYTVRTGCGREGKIVYRGGGRSGAFMGAAAVAAVAAVELGQVSVEGARTRGAPDTLRTALPRVSRS